MGTLYGIGLVGMGSGKKNEHVYSYCSERPPGTVKKGGEKGRDVGFYTRDAYRHRHRNCIVR